jgi:hypothetical protein
VFVPGKLFQPSLTHTLAHYKTCKSGTKNFIALGPDAEVDFFVSVGCLFNTKGIAQEEGDTILTLIL